MKYARIMTIVLSSIALTAATLIGEPVAAQTGGGELGPDYVRATASDLGAGTFSGRGLPSTEPAIEPPYTWTRTLTGAHCVLFDGPVPAELAGSVVALPGIEPVPGSSVQVGTLQGAEPGAVWLESGALVPAAAVWSGLFAVDTGTPRNGGSNLLVIPRCVSPGAPGPPPVPPSAATIWEQTPLPRAHLQASPPGTRDWPGIVNLESRFWSGALPEARATATLDGYVVDVTARPVAYAWTFGNGQTLVQPVAAEQTVPARITFRRRNDYRVTLHVVWEGVAHVTAPAFGLDLGVEDLGTVTLGEGVTHHVAEIRALLRSRSTAR